MAMIIELFRWWYGPGLLQVVRSITLWPKNVQRNFSVPLLLRNLFEPWRRIVSFGGKSVGMQFRAMIDNSVSRGVGFIVRLFVLFAAGISMLLASLAGFIVSILWPLIPLAIVYCLIRSII